ncbi:MAG: UDP-2,3-diacylglucosamine diphosphatase [Cyclobacteriaceae bacterium]
MNTEFASIPSNKKIYAASDFHLGAPDPEQSRNREDRIIRWINAITPSAAGLILAGDIFDFWFEYKTVVPKGSVRLLGKLAELHAAGIPIVIFTGNHDLWMQDYLGEEIGATIYHEPVSFKVGKLKIQIGHGDGLGPGDQKFKATKRIFKFGLNQWLFRWLHPDVGVKIANKWSEKSKEKELKKPKPFLGEDEPIFIHCKETEAKTHHDYYIFGHRHLMLNMPITEHSDYINLGDWINYHSYAEISQESVELKQFED